MSPQIMPEILKRENTIPILRPARKAILDKSYRPVTLLSPTVKVSQTRLHPIFIIFTNLGKYDTSPGGDTLLRWLNAIHNWINQPCPCLWTTLADLDLSNAFGYDQSHTTLEWHQQYTAPKLNNQINGQLFDWPTILRRVYMYKTNPRFVV